MHQHSYQVEQYINQCGQITHDQVAPFFSDYLLLATERLEAAMDSAKSNREIVEISDDLRTFRRQSNEITMRFTEQISQSFGLFLQKELELDPEDYDDSDSSTLKLVEQEDLEETLAYTSIITKSNQEFEESLWLLAKRLEVIQGSPINACSNPISPIQFCNALKLSLKNTHLCSRSVVIMFKAFEECVNQFLETLYQEVNSYLITLGILPNLTLKGSPLAIKSNKLNIARKGTLRKEMPANEPNQLSTESDPKEAEQADLMKAIRQLQKLEGEKQLNAENKTGDKAQSNQNHHAGLNHHDTKPVQGEVIPAHDSPALNAKEIVNAINQIQQIDAQNIQRLEKNNLDQANLLHSKDKLIEELTAKTGNGKIDTKDMYTINLVGIMFDYILKDKEIPNSVKTILSCLHTPFLKLAFLDLNLFEKSKHPARLLLDDLADTGATWISGDGEDQYGVFDEIKTITTKVMQGFNNDVSFFEEILSDLQKFKKIVKNKHEIKERNAIERAQGEERLNNAKTRAKKEIEDRVKNSKLPPAAVNFFKPWYSYITLLLLRDDGNDKNEETWKRSLHIIDEVSHYFNLNNENLALPDFEKWYIGFIPEAKEYIESMGYDKIKGKVIFDELDQYVKTFIAEKTKENAINAELKVEQSDIGVVDKDQSNKDQNNDLQNNDLQNSSPENLSRENNPTSYTVNNTKNTTTKSSTTNNLNQTNSFFTAVKPIKTKEETEESKDASLLDIMKQIEIGNWFEFNDKDKMKVKSFNPKIMRYMLINLSGDKVRAISRLELARQIQAKQVKMVTTPSKPLFNRSLEGVKQQLEREVNYQYS